MNILQDRWRKPAQWSVLTYIAAHNNLEMLGKVSRKQILGVGSTPDVVHGMLYDGPGGRPLRRRRSGHRSEQEAWRSSTPAIPMRSSRPRDWFFGKHPADRYGLVLWSHGTGWQPEEIAQVAEEARPTRPRSRSARARRHARQPSLFRSTLRRCSRPRRAPNARSSSTTAPGNRSTRWNWNGCGRARGDHRPAARVPRDGRVSDGQPRSGLSAQTSCARSSRRASWCPGTAGRTPRSTASFATIQTGRAALARLASTSTSSSTRRALPPPATSPKSRSTSGTSTPRRSGSYLADALTQDMAKHTAVIWEVQRDTQRERRRRQADAQQVRLSPLGSGIGCGRHRREPQRVGGGARCRGAVTAALEPGGAVLAEGHRGDWFDGTGGLSVYLMPPGIQRVSPSYGQLAFARDMHWLDMLTKYHELSRPDLGGTCNGLRRLHPRGKRDHRARDATPSLPGAGARRDGARGSRHDHHRESTIWRACSMARGRDVTEDDLIEIGRGLSAADPAVDNVPGKPSIREMLARRLLAADGRAFAFGCGCRALAGLPWEYTYVDRAGGDGMDGFLALDPRVAFVRDEVLGTLPVTPCPATCASWSRWPLRQTWTSSTWLPNSGSSAPR